MILEMDGEEIEEYFNYLDTLRESGATNMWGARPFLQKEFDLDGKVAGKILSAWMHTFDGKSNHYVRAKQALKDGLL